MTNVTAGAYADLPLFLFHLLEFMDVDYTLDVEEINERWRELAAVDVWAQLIMKEPNDSVERILAAPRTGTYRLNEDGSLEFLQASHDWHDLRTENECFFLRVYAPGDYRFKGADLGHPRHQGPHADRRGADAAMPAVHQGHPGHVRQRAPDPAAGLHADGGREVAQAPPSVRQVELDGGCSSRFA